MAEKLSGRLYGFSEPGKYIFIDIIVRPSGFEFSVEEKTYIIEYSQCKISKGGFDNKYIVIQAKTDGKDISLYIEKEANDFIKILERNGVRYEYLNNLRNILKKKSSSKGIYLIILIIFLIFSGLWIFRDNIVDIIVQNIPLEFDIKLGYYTYTNFILGKNICNDETLLQSVENITQKFREVDPHIKHNLTVVVVESSIPNAFALPDGHIIIFTGLIEITDNYYELAAVIAHEIGHIKNRHAIKNLVKRSGLKLLFTLINVYGSGTSDIFASLGETLLTLSFSREQEREADKYAIDLIYRSGYDPHAMINFFKTLKKNMPESPIASIMSTHPPTDERIQYLSEEIKKRGEIRNKTVIELPWDDIKNRCIDIYIK